jgi:hypothetical protein
MPVLLQLDAALSDKDKLKSSLNKALGHETAAPAAAATAEPAAKPAETDTPAAPVETAPAATAAPQ